MRALSLVGEALLAALSLVIVEALVTAVLAHAMLVSGDEVRMLVRAVPLATWVVAAPFALVGALGLELVVRRSRAGVGGLVALYAGAVAAGVTTGRHFASLPVRGAFVVGVAGAGLALGVVATRPLAKLVARTPKLVALGAGVIAAGACVIDHVVLPRLYPAFHLGLAALAAAVAPGLALAVVRRDEAAGRGRAITAGVTVALLAGAAAALPSLSRKLERQDNVRFVVVERATLGRHGVEAMARITPPETGAGAEIDTPMETARLLDLSGRDLVVISVDALRADHVGAYGYERGTTPHLDALAKEGVVFEHAYTATPHTSYAVTSLMTGKYMRPLLLAGAGSDSDTFAKLLRTYGYRTAAFYPPAVFFIDEDRFTSFRETGLDFEYRRVEFLGAPERAGQVRAYLAKRRPDRRVFLWVHLFEPHEPYETHEKSFGERDLDRYDGEVFEADRGIGDIVAEVRKVSPDATIVVTADHGEEFGEHGGRYHGTTVYEEQVRVPLVVVAPGRVAPRRVKQPVQTVDLLPTVLSSLGIPRPARVRGRDLSPWLVGKPEDQGLAFAETDDQTLLAEGSLRLVCERRIGACRLFDLSAPDRGAVDASPRLGERRDAMRAKLRELEAAHGRYERAGLRKEGKAWPEALRRGTAGDGDAAVDVAALLDDADVAFRRKAAEVLYELARPETAPALRLALSREDDDLTRRWCAVALTRVGEGSARTLELVSDDDLAWRRVAALALGEQGDKRGLATLIDWLDEGKAGFSRDREIIAALAKLGDRRAAPPIARRLGDVRLRVHAAEALAKLKEPVTRVAVEEAFSKERYAPARLALGRALAELGAGPEIAPTLTRFLGVPDPVTEGLGWAERTRILVSIGGPDTKDLDHLRDRSTGPIRMQMVVPKGVAARDGLRLWVRGRSRDREPARVRVGPLANLTRDGQGGLIELDGPRSVTLELPPGDAAERFVDVPPSWGLGRGKLAVLGVDKPAAGVLTSMAVVPLADELPPPPKEPWTPGPGDSAEDP